jgi:NAD(P)H-flavin reductase
LSTPFERREIPVAHRREVGPYVVLGAIDERATAAPGQFYMLASASRWGGGEGERPYLPRAISVMRTGVDGLVEFLLEDVGPGTRRLCELGAGERLAAVGPLGHGFEAPTQPALLVGGGIGIAPLVGLQERFGGRALVGFRDRAHARGAELFSDPELATDDGSLGHHGLVSELLEGALRQQVSAVCACGPPAMLASVRELAGAHGAHAQLALEAPMACGFGACHGCVVATVDGYRRVCLDGPVFDAALLA